MNWKFIKGPIRLVIFISICSGMINGERNLEETIDVTQDQDVQLKCRFSPELAKKSSTLFWIRTNREGHDNVAIDETPFQVGYRVDHKPQQGKYDLFITKANYDRDNGQFKCSLKEAGTGIELHSKSVELTVLLKPSPPSISPDNATATEGKPLNLTCASIGGSPPPEILWYKESTSIDNSALRSSQQNSPQSQPLEANLIVGRNKDEPTQSVLTIIPTKEDDASAYRCTVHNRALGQHQKHEKSTKIFVSYFPRVSVGPENPLQVERDETAQLACEVDAKPGVSTVKWERNGRFIDTNFKHTIPRVTIQDAGTYVCSADNGLGQAGKAELKLDVLYGPVVTVEGQQREFNEGDNIEVMCRADANPRPSKIQWFKEGDERFVQNGPTLRLNGVTAANNGRYICSAINHLRTSTKGELTRTGNATISLNIKHKPGRSNITPENPKAIVGRKITLTCGATPPGYPNPTYRWWKDDSDIALAVGSEYTIDSARLNNAGKYHCKPSNNLGEGTTASVELEVNQAPKIITNLIPEITKRKGDTGFAITCSADGKPKPKVRWFKDGQEILDSESNSYQIKTNEQENIKNMPFTIVSTLKFMGPDRIADRQIEPTDRGNYTCRFENDVGETKMSIAESTMNMRIEHAPVVAHHHNKVAFDIGDEAFIKCNMQAFPVPRFDWSYNQNNLNLDRTSYGISNTELENDIYQGTLRIKEVTPDKYGDYTCKATNSMGAKRTIIKLQRKGKPEHPTNVRIINVGYNFITIGFDPGFDGGYNDTTHTLEYRISGGKPKYHQCGKLRTYCNITDLEQYSPYFMKIKAHNIKGESKYTGEFKAITKIDVNSIPKPENVHYETESKKAFFDVNRADKKYMPLVAKIELLIPDSATWMDYVELGIEPGSSHAFKETNQIRDKVVKNLRVRLCVDQSDEILCGAYTEAQIVDVRPASYNQAAMNWQIPLIIGLIVLTMVGFCGICYCCRSQRNKISGSHASKKDTRDRPSIVHTTQPPPYHHGGIENKGVDTLKDADEMIKNNFGVAFEPQSASNSNSANGGSVNSQDSLWNVKGVPPAVPQSHDPNLIHQQMMHNAYQMQAQGYTVYDAMAMQQQQQLQQQQQQQQQQQLQQQQHLQQQYPEDYTHYPHPEEYLNERNQHFVSNGEFFRPGPHESEYSPYGDMGGVPGYHHHQFHLAENGFEEPQTPTLRDQPPPPPPGMQMGQPGGPGQQVPGGQMGHPGGQMSFDAIDGVGIDHAGNSGSYNAGQQQRRIIREIIV